MLLAHCSVRQKLNHASSVQFSYVDVYAAYFIRYYAAVLIGRVTALARLSVLPLNSKTKSADKSKWSECLTGQE